MENLKDSVAVVTGAGDGMGRAMSLAFAAQGAHLVLADIDRQRLERVEAEAQQFGVEVLTTLTDVSDAEAVQAMADATYERFERCNVLCNNAGVVSSLGTPIKDLGLDAWDWVLDVNVKGVVHGLRGFLERMLEGGEPGHIVNTASIAGLNIGAGGGAYGASKHAVVAISRSLRAELAGTNLGVSVLCPGLVATGLVANTRSLAEARTDRSEDERAAGIDPETMERLGHVLDEGMKPERVAEMVLDSIRSNRFYIITHADSGERLQAQLDEILADERDLRERFPE
ncbi:MAG: SDR family NAD(P)-dependent oxidoreductase [Gammaproteobacteria bacterium]|nr:SDR family NAD(P)-dependent oxidoreductase [Gammaproteobacteria bacterium]